MSDPEPLPLLLPLVDAPPRERSDAARNRTALLEAAQRLIASCGIDALTMDGVAAAAGVGKGTVFRQVPLARGPDGGAARPLRDRVAGGRDVRAAAARARARQPWERLVAFGRSRLETTLLHADLIRNAGRMSTRSYAAYSFAAMHVRYLLSELGVTGDLPLLATALMAPLEAPILDQQVRIEGLAIDRVHAGWVDLARRVVGPV